jgi:hypothetical protein
MCDERPDLTRAVVRMKRNFRTWLNLNFWFGRNPGAIAGFRVRWIVRCSSLIVCAQCFSCDWLAIEKDSLYRVIR